uniref:oleoyl-[acyl-carrier-protein] hydrolase n=1 Tax=Otolemur garnettii TaxID=30611 RepID=H0XZR4_OTOGA
IEAGEYEPSSGLLNNNNCNNQNLDAIFKLICFSWTRGDSNYFKWGQKIHNSLEVHPVRFAGKERIFFAKDIYQVVDKIVCAMFPVTQDKLFAFFGHSMVFYLAFMTTLHLKGKYKLEPVHFFVSSTTSPHSKAQSYIPKDSKLSEEQISHHLMDFGGIAKIEVAEDKQLLQQYIPILVTYAYMTSIYTLDKPSKAILSIDLLMCFIGSKGIEK